MPTIGTEEQSIYYEVTGEGPAIVFLHGATGDSSTYWENQVPFFSQDFEVITVDIRGHGRSKLGVVTVDYIEDCADDLRRILDELNISEAHIVGLSKGGLVAQRFALKHPQRLRRLVLADTSSGIKSEKMRRFLEDVLIKTAERSDMEHVFDLNLLWAHSARYLEENKDRIALERKHFAETSVEEYIALMKTTSVADITDQLPKIIAPTLVIWGSEDIEIPRLYSEILARNIPNAMLVIIEGAGHKSCVDRPEEFNKVVNTFLKEV
jgi:pimeloyl-ACP methyl ester carboxylesterase